MWRVAFDPVQLAFGAGQEVYRSGLLWAINGRRFSAGLSPVSWPRVAATPAHEVWSSGALRLLRYAAPAGTSAPRPSVLLVCSLINRPYVLDLIEERSVVRRLLEGGLDVWLLDWGAPGPADVERGLADYALRLLPEAMARIRAQTGDAPLHILGYCMGGTLALMALATGAARADGLVALATPVDFHDDGLLSRWCRAPSFDARQLAAAHGNIPPWILQPAFKMLDPVGLSTKLLHLDGKIGDDAFLRFFLAMETWLEDSVSFPGRAFMEWVELYRSNALVKGALVLDGRRVNLRRISCPVLSLVAAGDYITPPASSAALLAQLQPRPSELRLAGGHIGLSTGSQAQRELWPAVARWIGAQSEVRAAARAKASVRAPAAAPAPPRPRRPAKPVVQPQKRKGGRR